MEEFRCDFRGCDKICESANSLKFHKIRHGKEKRIKDLVSGKFIKRAREELIEQGGEPSKKPKSIKKCVKFSHESDNAFVFNGNEVIFEDRAYELDDDEEVLIEWKRKDNGTNSVEEFRMSFDMIFENGDTIKIFSPFIKYKENIQLCEKNLKRIGCNIKWMEYKRPSDIRCRRKLKNNQKKALREINIENTGENKQIRLKYSQ